MRSSKDPLPIDTTPRGSKDDDPSRDQRVADRRPRHDLLVGCQPPDFDVGLPW